MKKKLNIPKDFWKDFKDRKDFDEFFGELFQEGINQMLKGEMTDHLGYEIGLPGNIKYREKMDHAYPRLGHDPATVFD